MFGFGLAFFGFSNDSTILKKDLTLADCGGDLEIWAEALQPLLTTEHFLDVEKVKTMGKNCSKCGSDKGCLKCHWPLAVRYWRNLEMRGKFAEGYIGGGKTKALKISSSKVDLIVET